MIESKKNEGFVNIFQGQVGRWVDGLSPATGLYTDEIKECLAVIVYGEKRGTRCFSLVHMDGSTPIEILQTEKKFMENGGFVVMLHEKESQACERVEQIKSAYPDTKITHRYFPENHDAIFVNLAEGEKEELPVTISSASSREFDQILYNSPDHMRLYATYKFNTLLSEIQAEIQTDSILMMGGKVLDRKSEYPKTRLLFDGIRFCSREKDIYYLDCAKEFLAEMGEIFRNKPPKLFLEVNMRFLKYFHKKAPFLTENEVQIYFNEASCEIARIYCYLTERLDLIRASTLFNYWSHMVERYSRVIDLPPTKLAAKNSSADAAVLGVSLSKGLRNSADSSTMISDNLASGNLAHQLLKKK